MSPRNRGEHVGARTLFPRSVLSPKYEVFCRRSVGCFSRRERSAHIWFIRVERATRKNSQLAPARKVAMKMGRRLRCSSVTYRSRYAPSTASPARTALPAAHFDRNESHAIFGTGHQGMSKKNSGDGEIAVAAGPGPRVAFSRGVPPELMAIGSMLCVQLGAAL